jgi:N-carbamoylputrescine amidase
MIVTDPIADYLTRLRNALQARHTIVEIPASNLKKNITEILFYPTAIGWASSQDESTNTEQYNAWQTIQRSHAIANGVHVVSVNRVGDEQNGNMHFWGGSFVSNPLGSVLYQASHHEEEIKIIEIDTTLTDKYRTHWPFLRDRRIDSYEPINKRFID